MTRLRRLLAIVGLIALLVLAAGTLMLMVAHETYGPWSAGAPFGRPLLMDGYGGAYGPPPTWTDRMERNGFGAYGPGYDGDWVMMESPGMWGTAMLPGPIGAGLDRDWGLPPLMSSYGQLDLTVEQEEKLDQLQLDLFQQEAALAAQLYEPEAQLRKLYAAGNADAATLDPVFSKIAQIQRRMFQARVATRTRFVSVLTPTQRQHLGRPGVDSGSP